MSDTILGAGWSTAGATASSIDAAHRGIGYLLHEGGEPVRMRTFYLTDEQRQWLGRATAKAQLQGLTVSANDLIRLALSRLQEQVPERQLTGS
jgi:hypothetical protein